MLFFARSLLAAESPCLYGIHDHSPDPSEYLNHIKNATGAGLYPIGVAVGGPL